MGLHKKKCVACQVDIKGDIIYVDTHYNKHNSYPLCVACYDIIYQFRREIYHSKLKDGSYHEYGSLFRTSLDRADILSQFQNMNEDVKNKFLGL